MPKLRFNMTMSLDGYVAGPGQSLENPLGEGGHGLHAWAFATRSFVFGGAALKGTLLRSWGTPGTSLAPRQTYAGAELHVAWIVKGSFGVLWRVSGGAGIPNSLATDNLSGRGRRFEPLTAWTTQTARPLPFSSPAGALPAEHQSRQRAIAGCVLASR